MLIAFILSLALVQTDAHEAEQREWHSSYEDLHGDWETRNALAIAAVDACSDVASCLLVEERHRSDLGPDGRMALGDRILAFGPVGRSALVDLAIDERSSFAIGALTRADGWTDREIDRLISDIGSDPGNRLTRVLASTGDPRAEAVILRLLFSSDESYSDLTEAAVTLVPSRWRDMLNEWERRSAAGMDTWAVEYVFTRADPGAHVVREIAAETANDRRRSRRLVAVMALSEMGEAAIAVEPDLVRLANDPDTEIATIARSGLMMMGNTQFAVQIATERCVPITDAFAPYLHEISNCPYYYFQRNPDAAIAAGEVLRRLLSSPHADQRSIVARTLSEAGDTRIIPRLRAMLTSANWRDVNAALEALRRLEAVEASGDMRALSVSHWHPYIRERARRAAEALETGAPSDFPPGEPHYERLWADSYPRPECTSGRWVWQGSELPAIEAQVAYEPADSFGAERRLDIATGYLTGSDRGEWGGELVWHSGSNEPAILIERNIRTMLPYRDGALISTGLAHLGMQEGAVFRVEFSPEGDPEIFQVAELPGAPLGGMAHITDRLYAVSELRSEVDPDGFVTVFDAEIGILGLADCVAD